MEDITKRAARIPLNKEIYERNIFALRNDNFKQVQKHKSTCNRCGMTGHWGRTCRTAKHLVDLYQASQKNKGKGAKANFVNETSTSGPTLDVSDFFSEDVNLHKVDPQEEDNYFF